MPDGLDFDNIPTIDNLINPSSDSNMTSNINTATIDRAASNIDNTHQIADKDNFSNILENFSSKNDLLENDYDTVLGYNNNSKHNNKDYMALD